MKLTKPQQLVINFITASENRAVYSTTLENSFNKKTIDNLLSKGLIVRTHHSRLRTDDMEMVYWSCYELPKTELTKVLT